MWKISFIFIILPAAIQCLECYVCENQDSNYDKCIKTIKTCDISQDRCLSEIRWGSTPYWDFTGKKQFYISKTCATERDCKKSIDEVSKRCNRIWYNDWECAECCHGDRCNYYVTLSGVSIKPQTIFYVLDYPLYENIIASLRPSILSKMKPNRKQILIDTESWGHCCTMYHF